MLKGRLVNNDNLHLIAISNLKSDEKQLIRWWCDHYRQPQKALDDYTFEELFIEQLEHYYSKNPDKVSEFFSRRKPEEEWDGQFDEKTEKEIQRRLKKRPQVDISKYQSDRVVSDEEADRIIASVGKSLPGSKIRHSPRITEDEFEEQFG